MKQGYRMNDKIILYIGMIVASILLFSTPLSAKTDAKKENIVNSEKIKLVNLAGEQRMLSQRLAKDYLYTGKNIAMNKTQKQ